MTDNSKLAMFIPLLKVDMQKREVWGRGTQEVVDGHGEIMDYATSVPYFKKWSADAEQRSGGKSKGNLRAMHQPIAAGKLIDIQFNDDEKAIDIGTYVSDDNEWQKVLDGTYTGFSVGGDYAKRWMDMQKAGVTRFTAAPHEISLVDAPAVSTAVFELVKLDGSREMRKIGVGAPAFADLVKTDAPEVSELGKTEIPEAAKSHILEPGIAAEDVKVEDGNTEGALPTGEPELEETLTNEQVVNIPNVENFVPDVAHDGKLREIDPDTTKVIAPVGVVAKSEAVAETPEPEWLAGFKEIAKSFSANVAKMVELRENDAEMNEKVNAMLKLRSSRVGIDRREGEPLTAPQNNPTDWTKYGDPVNWKYPVAKGHSGTTLVRYNLRKDAALYSAREWNIIGRRIARLASEEFGVTYKFDPATKQVRRLSKEKNPMTDLKKDANPMGLLREVAQQLNAASEIIGSDPAAAKDLLMQMVAAIDVASDVAPVNPASNTPPALPTAETPVAAAVSAGDLQTAFPVPAKEEERVPPKAEEEAEGEVAKAMKSALAPLMDMLAKQQDALTAQNARIEELQKAQANPFAQLFEGAPAGDLQAIIEKNTEEDNPLLKAMNEGNLLKALDVVGHDTNKLYDQVNTLAVDQLRKQGISVARYIMYPAPADN